MPSLDLIVACVMALSLLAMARRQTRDNRVRVTVRRQLRR